MNYEELADLWKSQPDRRLANEDTIVSMLRTLHRGDERKIVWLNFQEGIPSVALFVFFCWISSVFPFGKWAFHLAAVLCLGVGLFLVTSTIRQRKRESQFGDSVKEQVKKSLSQIKHREWLYQNILWWYLLPLVLGWGAALVVITIEIGEIATFAVFALLALYVIACFVFFGMVYRLNQRVGQRYTARRKHLEEILETFDSGDE